MRYVSESERNVAVDAASDDFVAGLLTIEELEAQVTAALRGLVDGTCRYLSPFRDPSKPERR